MMPIQSAVRRTLWMRGVLGVGIVLCCVTGGACQLGYYLVDPDMKRDVKAEYNKIADRKIAVVVWADRSTLDMYPRARYHVGKAVTWHLKKHLPDARFVGSEEVDRLQERSGLRWEGMSAVRLCEVLDCDLVLRVDLLAYTPRASDTRELRRGRVRGTLNLFKGGADGGEEPVYGSEVLQIYPPESSHGISDLNETQILHRTVELFAEAVARKFYDHGVSMRGPSRR